MLNSHIKNHPYNSDYDRDYTEDLLDERKQSDNLKDPEFIKHYIRYARERCKPVLSEKNLELVKTFYIKLREEAKSSDGLHIATRHIESIIRISTGTSITKFSPCPDETQK